MAAERRTVGHDDTVAQPAVVRDVGIGHEQVVVADPRDALVVSGAAIDGAALPEHVPLADLQPRRLTLVFLVLRRVTDRGELEELVVGTDRRQAGDDHVRTDAGTRPDAHARSDDREGADLDVGGELGLRRDYRVRVDHGPGSAAAALAMPGASMSSAAAASASSTAARVDRRQMPRRFRSSLAVRMS